MGVESCIRKNGFRESLCIRKNGFTERERERERERALSEKMRTKNGFTERERESCIEKNENARV